MMGQPLVSLIVLNWNGVSLLRECIDSLKNLEYKHTQIIVVDNASTDGSLDLLAGIEGITVVKNPENLGYAAGNNAGFRVAQGTYVATLNNDIVVDQKWLNETVRMLETGPDIGIISCRQMNYHHRDTIDALYSYLHPSLIFFQEAFRKRFDASEGPQVPFQVLGASGASTVYRKTMLDELGGLDETLYAYHEESDLCMRAFLSGWKCVYIPAAVSYHHRSVSFNRIKGTMFYFQTRNRFWFIYKYTPLSLLLKNFFWVIFTELRIIRIVIFRERVFSSYVRGVLDGMRGLAGLTAVRRENMRRLRGKMNLYSRLRTRKYIPLFPTRQKR
jgi:GT2 family glycosyltransferase